MDIEATLRRTDEDDVAERAGQVGLAARGVLYAVSALLTVRVAQSGGASDAGPGKDGALRAVAQQPFGRALLVVLAVGCAGYAVWRFIGAWTYEPDDDDSDAKAWGKRAALVGRGVVYLVAVWTAVQLVLDDDASQSSGGSSGGGASGQSTEFAFDLPFGRWIVLAFGLGLLAAAGHNLWRAISGKYREKWEGGMSATERRWAVAVSEIGLCGHAAVFGLVGWFLVKAAVEYDPDEPESLDQAVHALAGSGPGTWLLYALAFGMACYAAFSFVEARWRILVE